MKQVKAEHIKFIKFDGFAWRCYDCGALNGDPKYDETRGTEVMCARCGQEFNVLAELSGSKNDCGETDVVEETDVSGDLPQYASLRKILARAYNQAAFGKGKERHATGQNFEDQPIIVIQDLVGEGFALGQAVKKIQESTRLEFAKAVPELLGAIIYIVASIIFSEKEFIKKEEKNG